MPSKASDSASNTSLAVLRDDIVPATVDRIPGAEVGVSGFTAESKDFSDKIKAVAPLVFGFVLVFALASCCSRSARSCSPGRRSSSTSCPLQLPTK